MFGRAASLLCYPSVMPRTRITPREFAIYRIAELLSREGGQKYDREAALNRQGRLRLGKVRPRGTGPSRG